MKECRWPKGHCPQWTWDEEKFCTYHWKVDQGLFESRSGRTIVLDDQLALLQALGVLHQARRGRAR